MTATIENIVGMQSAIEHAKSLKSYSNMGISAALVIEMGDTLAAQAKEIEALKAQVLAQQLKNEQLEVALGQRTEYINSISNLVDQAVAHGYNCGYQTSYVDHDAGIRDAIEIFGQ